MEDRPREMELSIDGLPGAVMWTETGSRESAGRSVRRLVDADRVGKLRIFVMAPAEGEGRDEFVFTVRALDRDGGSDSTEARFERPER